MFCGWSSEMTPEMLVDAYSLDTELGITILVRPGLKPSLIFIFIFN